MIIYSNMLEIIASYHEILIRLKLSTEHKHRGEWVILLHEEMWKYILLVSGIVAFFT